MPQDKRRFYRDDCPSMLGDEPRSIVGHRANGRNLSGVREAAGGADQVFSTGRGLSRQAVTVFRLGIELHAHRIWAEFAKKDMYLENVLPVFFFNGRAPKTQARPVLRKSGLPSDQIHSERTLLCRTFPIRRSSRKIMLLHVFADDAVR